MKKRIDVGLLIISIFTFLFGLMFVVVDAYKINKVIFGIIGIILVITAIPGFLVPVSESKENKVTFINSIILFISGILMLFDHSSVLNIICAIIFIVIPLINLFYALDKKKRFLNDLPKYIIGILVLILSIDGVLNIIYTIIGIILIIISLIIFCGSFLDNKIIIIKKNHHNKDDIIDGKAEEVK